MTFKDQFRFVKQNMKKNKSRLFMTILATSIGCAFLIVLASVGFGLHKSIIQDMMENQLVTQVEIYNKQDSDGVYKGLDDEDVAYLEKIDAVKAVTRRQALQQMPLFKTDDYSLSAESIVAHFPSELKADFQLSKGKLPEKENEIIVGYHFSKHLMKETKGEDNPYNDDGSVKKEYAYEGDLLGKTIDMEVLKIDKGEETTETLPLTIVGIAKQPSREWMIDTNVFISESVLDKVESFTGVRGGAQEMYDGGEVTKNGNKTYDYVRVYGNNVQDITAISEKLEDSNYQIYSVVSEMKQINAVFLIMKIGLIFIGTIALIIASIGIYNTMTMAVTERAPDIGIMKAIGANPKTIKNIFLLESSYIGLLGAAFGTIVAYGISYLVNLALPMIVNSVFEEAPPEGLMLSYIPWSLTVISVVICLAVTIFSGLRPAKRATKVDVLKAMRREV
ncbi:ABC transporter permease [Cytobacillus purgationiresistens]|uniref:Acetoin utilization transport system permease protein n=1 Tax=Cytobacillus purgationiresistens TaxID=863449 RepID=A0ABU0ANY6_9BACI|nr:FtsX-like permease family protein [Cytobacillus purgationiresistens]MDQ0272482.1 acetoin utilization transport system permease protein [Cytobacillus purgationiresistens]